MSGIELKPLSESKFGRSNFLLPLGKTIIGRGPILGVSDKRVSRNHGVVKVEDGKLKIMSTHTNPTFYQAKGTSKLLPLPKEVWQFLEHGDRIALTPDQHVYEVVIDERPLNKSSQSLGASPTDSPVKRSSQKHQKQTDEEEEDKDGQENNRQKDQTGADETIQSNNANDGTKQSKEGVEDKEEKRDEAKDDAEEDAEEDAEDGEEAELSVVTKGKADVVKLPGQKEMALPLERERKLPAWMAVLGAGSTAAKDKPAPKEATRGRGRGRPKVAGAAAATSKTATPKTATPKRTRKPPSISDGASEEDYQPAAKRTPSRGRGRPKVHGKGKGTGGGKHRRHHSDNDDDDDEKEDVIADDVGDEGDEAGEADEAEGPKRWGHGKTRDQASVKRRAKLAMDYFEDFMVSEEEEEEEELPVPEGDDGSDWEPESHSLTRIPSKGKRTSGRTSGRKRAGGRRYNRQNRQSSDDDSDLSEEEVYIPRPTKRSGRAASSSQEIELSEDAPRKRAKKTDNGKKKREVCQYGKKCYRKNPSHTEEFSHPGDSDYASPKSDADDDDDVDDVVVDKEECPHGTGCYRKNKRHLEQYKHTKAPGRPKRQAAKKRGAKATVVDGASDDDDDGEVNTHDCNDSLLDDGTQEMGKNSESDD